jgi:excisionase family DNA binding protein
MVRQRKPQGARWKDYLTRRELMKRLGVSLPTLARMDAAGRLPESIVFGGVRLYRKADVEKWEAKMMRPKPRK